MYLGIETSTAVCSVALFSPGGVIEEMTERKGKSHSSHLTLMIEKLLRGHKMKTNDLSGVVFSDGPGSYTGLRIGASVAKGICFVHEIPMFSYSGLRAVAMKSRIEAGKNDIYIGCSDARRDDIYVYGLSNLGQEILSPRLWTIGEDLVNFSDNNSKQKIIMCGEGCKKLVEYDLPKQIILHEIGHSAANLHYCMKYDTEIQDVINTLVFEPFYMQKPNITTSKKLFV